jgi:hypothetical protein
MNENINLIDLVISKYLSGNVTPEDFALLSDWLKTSEENRNYFVQQKALWLGANEHLNSPNEEKWELLKFRLEERQQSKHQERNEPASCKNVKISEFTDTQQLSYYSFASFFGLFYAKNGKIQGCLQTNW